MSPYSNYNAFNNLANSLLPCKIPTPLLKRYRRMADFIRPKRLSFAKEMGVASKSTSKKLDVTLIKPNVKKLMLIKFETIDVAAIQFQVDKIAINTLPAEHTEIVSNEEIAKRLGLDYIKLLSLKIIAADRRAAVHQILER